jgi:hypothetical protein
MRQGGALVQIRVQAERIKAAQEARSHFEQHVLTELDELRRESARMRGEQQWQQQSLDRPEFNELHRSVQMRGEQKLQQQSLDGPAEFAAPQDSQVQMEAVECDPLLNTVGPKGSSLSKPKGSTGKPAQSHLPLPPQLSWPSFSSGPPLRSAVAATAHPSVSSRRVSRKQSMRPAPLGTGSQIPLWTHPLGHSQAGASPTLPYDVSFPLRLGAGPPTIIGWHHGETPEAIAYRFVLDNKLAKDFFADVQGFVAYVIDEMAKDKAKTVEAEIQNIKAQFIDISKLPSDISRSPSDCDSGAGTPPASEEHEDSPAQRTEFDRENHLHGDERDHDPTSSRSPGVLSNRGFFASSIIVVCRARLRCKRRITVHTICVWQLHVRLVSRSRLLSRLHTPTATVI